MSKAYLFVLLLLAACAAPNWKTYKIDQHLTVALPTRPYPVNLANTRFTSSATQEIARSAAVQALSATSGTDSYGILINATALPADLRQPVAPDSFYNLGIRHALQREHSRLLQRSAFATPAGPGVEVKFGLAPATGNAAVQYVRTVLVGRASYTFIFTPRNDVASAEQRRRFFNSIRVKP